MIAAAAAGVAFGCGADTQHIELTASDPNPAGSPPAVAMDSWAAQISQQSGGRLKVTVYHDATLLSMDKWYTGVQTGIADFGMYVPDIKDGLLLNNVMMLPFMGWPDEHKTGRIYWDLLAAYPAMKAEWKGLRVVGMTIMPGTHIHNVVREIRTPDDMYGLKTMAADGVLADSARAAGAIGVQVDMTKMNDALAAGTVEAVINFFGVLAAYNVLEPLKYHTMFGAGGINLTPLVIIMNSDVYGNLPKDLQSIVDAAGSTFEEMSFNGPALTSAAIAQAQAWGHSFVQLTPDEVAVWYDLVKVPILDQWIAAAQVAGLPGQALFDDTLARIRAATSQ
jgi:TRAP-type C4-dicarboxylate transport system substrate-binding protein